MFRDSTKWKSLFSVSEIVSTKKRLFYQSFSFNEVTFVKEREDRSIWPFYELHAR